MSFSQTLQSIVNRVEGGAGAVILGIDGIIIERFVKAMPADLDLELIATELSTLLIRSVHTATDTGLGDLREMLFATELMTFVLRPITSEYFLLFGLNPGGNVGRARFELRKAQLALEAEFAI
ncbi:MAG: roadblock/LC7 domain-containing protein [Acidobacteria bacterium]|nr:roadblock/LC7 domain-containing protein [Acidobacteriota bacterium]